MKLPQIHPQCRSHAWSLSTRRVLTGCAVWLALAGPGLAAAAEIQIPDNSVNESSAEVDECNDPKLSKYRKTTVTSSMGNCRITSKVTQLLATDTRIAGGNSTLSANMKHKVTFNVSSATPWVASVSHTRRGDIYLDDDNGKCASVLLGPITASVSGATPLASGSTTASYALCNCNQCGDCYSGTSGSCNGEPAHDRQDYVNDSKSFEISGPAGVTAVVLEFTWSATVYSDGNVAGGDDALVRLGLSANGEGWLASCDGAIDQAYYSPASIDGHEVVVSVISDEPVVQNLQAMKCSPVPQLQPCTYLASGTISGCVGNNYNVAVDFVDGSNNVLCTAVANVTNGDPNWAAANTCAGTCDAAVAVNVYATNKTGLLDPMDESWIAPARVSGPIAQAEVTLGPGCALAEVPGAGPVTRGALLAVLLASGFLLLRRRRSQPGGAAS